MPAIRLLHIAPPRRALVPGLFMAVVVVIVACQSGRAQEQAEPVPEEPGLALLDQATTAKFGVSKLSDLDIVVGLCHEALEKGLSPANQKFAREMITATLYEKANRLVASAVEGGRTTGWAQRRRVAAEALQDALKLDPDHAEAHLLMARMDLLPGGDVDRGRRSADRAVELLKENPERYSTALVVRSAYQEDLTARLADLDLAIAANPDNADAWRDRGRIHLINSQTDDAIEDFSKLLELNEDDLEAMDALARALAIEAKYEDALALVERLMKKQPESGEPYALRASIRIMQNELDQALPDLDRAIELEPEDPRNWLARSRLYESKKRWDDAMKDVDQLLQRSPGLLPALMQKVSLLIAQEKFSDAAAALHPVIQANPDNLELQYQLAGLHQAAKKPREAIKVYSEIIESADKPWEALRGRGDAYLNVGEHAEAVADYEKALAQQPEDSGILNNLSWVLATSTIDKVRDGQRALELAKKACDVTHYEQAHILSTLAAAYAELGQFDKAIEWSTKAVEKGEGDVKAQLQQELQSYEQGKPWREMNTVTDAENEDIEISMDDLKLDTAARAPEDKETAPSADKPRVPDDP